MFSLLLHSHSHERFLHSQKNVHSFSFGQTKTQRRPSPSPPQHRTSQPTPSPAARICSSRPLPPRRSVPATGSSRTAASATGTASLLATASTRYSRDHHWLHVPPLPRSSIVHHCEVTFCSVLVHILSSVFGILFIDVVGLHWWCIWYLLYLVSRSVLLVVSVDLLFRLSVSFVMLWL